jgi:chromosome segregation ATPase
MDLSLSDTEPLTERLAGITEQVTKLSDSLSKLGSEVEWSKLTRDAEKKEFNKRLTDLQEAHNSESTVINKHLDTFSSNFKVVDSMIGIIQKMVEDLDKGLNTIRTKLTVHGHDGLSLVPKLSSELKQVGEQIAKLRAEVGRAKVLAIRKPTDDFETIEYKDGSKHTYRVYKGKRGLSRPHRISIELFGDDSYVDLAEPID